MIEGPERVNYYNIFDKVDPYDVYKHYLGFSPEIRKLYLSPFRKDNRGSFGIVLSRDGNLIHNDFGDSRYKGNCIQFVQQLYGISFKDSIRKIVVDLGLERGECRIVKRITHEDKREPTLIQIIPRQFNHEDLCYWGLYDISKDDLISERVYSVRELYINKKRITTDNLSFAYLFEDNGAEYMKIYQPLSLRCKWLSNVPVKKALNLGQLERESRVITIAKSKKDKMVLRKLITDVYEVQKEGTEVVSDDLDSYFNSVYDRKVCFFDNDEPGKRANISLNPRGYGWINVPNKYYDEGIKDPSDLVRKYGYKPLKELLESKDYNITDNFSI